VKETLITSGRMSLRGKSNDRREFDLTKQSFVNQRIAFLDFSGPHSIPFGRRMFLAMTMLSQALVLSFFVSSLHAQDLEMRRSNSVGNWIGYLNNNGSLFNQSDSNHLSVLGFGAGGLWTGLGRFDTVVFGAGLWIGGLRNRSGSLAPHTEFSYNPNTALSEFAPGSLLYDGAVTDTLPAARDKYRVYRSDDLAGPSWPLRMVNGKTAYIDDPTLRDAAGAKAVFGDEDMFLIYKDSDPDSITDPFGLEVRSQVSFWRSGLLANVVIVQNEIVYSGNDTIFDPVVALVVDGDINYPKDDRTKGVQDEGTRATVFFTDQSTTDPLLGVTVLAAQHGTGRLDAGVSSLRYWDLNDDPVSDSDRYTFLTEPRHDTALSIIGDARILMSSLSPVPLAPGDTVDFDYALYVQPATGPALTAVDSANMLQTARIIVANYRTGSMGALAVREQPTISTEMEAYPNPASNQLYVWNAIGRMMLFDMLGRQVAVAQTEFNQAVFDVRTLPAGVYFVRGEQGALAGQRGFSIEISH
jgi:hypothetical protein